MRTAFLLSTLTLGLTWTAAAAHFLGNAHNGISVERSAKSQRFALLIHGADPSPLHFQGLVVDRGCAMEMVKNGRAKTLKKRSDCSLNEGHYARSAYALITDDKKLYYFDQAGDQKALTLLKNTPDPDALRVIVTGDLQGQTIKVKDMSML